MYCIVHKVFYSLSQYLKWEKKTNHTGIAAAASSATTTNTTTTTPVVVAVVTFVIVIIIIIIKTFNNFGIHLL